MSVLKGSSSPANRFSSGGGGRSGGRGGAEGGGGPIGGGSGLSTKVSMDATPDEDEFDAVFGEGPLGMRLEEIAVTSQGEEGGLRYISEVTHVNPRGPAEKEGVEEGCVVMGINGEKFISHAHAVATLKHGKRPVTVRFQYPPGGGEEEEEEESGE